MTTTENRRPTVSLRLAATGAYITQAELLACVKLGYLDTYGAITPLGEDLIEDLGPLPVRDAVLTWTVERGRHVARHGDYVAIVIRGHVSIVGSRLAELYTADTATSEGGKGLAQEWIRAVENQDCDRLGL